MSTAPLVPTGSLRAQAYASFQQQIVDANIHPGQFISQRELMQLLDMPLDAVRELIPRLEAEGLLKTVPQRGLQVAHVDLKLINNAFQLRQLLEREAATRFVATVTDHELVAVEQSHLNIVQRARSGRIDDDLHDLMIDALGNELIPAMEEHLWFIEALKRCEAQAVLERLVHHIEGEHLRVLGLPRLEIPWSLESPA